LVLAAGFALLTALIWLGAGRQTIPGPGGSTPLEREPIQDSHAESPPVDGEFEDSEYVALGREQAAPEPEAPSEVTSQSQEAADQLSYDAELLQRYLVEFEAEPTAPNAHTLLVQCIVSWGDARGTSVFVEPGQEDRPRLATTEDRRWTMRSDERGTRVVEFNSSDFPEMWELEELEAQAEEFETPVVPQEVMESVLMRARKVLIDIGR
jgi:hypothetical protein